MPAAGDVEAGRRRWINRLGLLAVVGIGLAACTSGGTYRPQAERVPVYPPAAFTHRVATSDVEIYWNCSQPEPGVLRVNGVAKNTGGREVRFLQLQLDSVDAKDRKILEAAAAVPDIVLYTNQLSPFQMDLRTMGSEARYHLYYQYRLAPRLGVTRIKSELSEEAFLARDVCSPTEHRVSHMGG